MATRTRCPPRPILGAVCFWHDHHAIFIQSCNTSRCLYYHNRRNMGRNRIQKQLGAAKNTSPYTKATAADMLLALLKFSKAANVRRQQTPTNAPMLPQKQQQPTFPVAYNAQHGGAAATSTGASRDNCELSNSSVAVYKLRKPVARVPEGNTGNAESPSAVQLRQPEQDRAEKCVVRALKISGIVIPESAERLTIYRQPVADGCSILLKWS